MMTGDNMLYDNSVSRVNDGTKTITLLSLFTSNKEIFAISTTILLLEILVDIFRAFSHILENSLNAVGDVKATFAISIFSGGCLNVLGAYIFGVVLRLGLNGIWIAFILDEGFKSIIYYIRWKKRKMGKY